MALEKETYLSLSSTLQQIFELLSFLICENKLDLSHTPGMLVAEGDWFPRTGFVTQRCSTNHPPQVESC